MNIEQQLSSSEYWENILYQSSKRVKEIEGSILFLGDKGSGKSNILNNYCEKQNKLNNEIISYDYFLSSDFDDVNLTSRINVWSFNEFNYLIFSKNLLNLINYKNNNQVRIRIIYIFIL